jgi:transcription-repair coupling factor (superfamily II helicase)
VIRLAQLDAALDAALEARRDAARVSLGGLAGGAAGLVLARLRARAAAPLVVVAPDGLRAALLADGLGAFLGRPDAAVVFPAWEHLPYQGVTPPHRLGAERMAVLARLALGDLPEALVVSAPTLLDRLPPRAVVAAATRVLEVGGSYPRERLVADLVASGYVRVPQADDVGAIALRGDVLDVFPAGADLPVRLEFFDDALESIRTFDPWGKTAAAASTPLARVVIPPARDLILTPDTPACVRGHLQALADARGTPSSRVRAIVTDLEHGIVGVGLEDLLPAFYPALDGLLDYLDAAASSNPWHLVVDAPDKVADRLQARADDLASRAERAAQRPGELVFPVSAGWLPPEPVAARLEATARLTLGRHRTVGSGEAAPRALATRDLSELRRAIETGLGAGELDVLNGAVELLTTWHRDGATLIACAGSLGGLERLRALLASYPVRLVAHDQPGAIEAALPAVLAAAASPDMAARDGKRPTLHLVVAHPGEGFIWPDGGLVVIDQSEILGKPPKPRRRTRRPPPELAIQSWRDLHPGDLVVHLERGVGRYLGLDTYEATAPDGGGVRSDLVVLEYAGGDKLYVPIEKLHLIARHQGGDSAPTLDRLGGDRWQKTKSRVTRAVRDIAAKLLRIHAEREARRGTAFSPPDELCHRFDAAFPWDETPDQARAIDDVLRDLTRPRPMDRLVCGDVGFGKTEVAMRAAMKVVADGWQVAVVVPTQVLAEQHRQSFVRRFEGFPVLIDALTAERRTVDQKALVEAIAEGRVDIVVGTHRLLSQDVRFKRLGLLIIDEEHRFGVAQKERLRELRPTVDVLTLSATPIPRTLHMALVNLRDMSLIQTPPTDRQPVETCMAQPTDEVITDAIRRELLRGGQVFFVHHRVSDIDKIAELIGRLVPEARVAVGHGQMPPGALERVMTRFVSGEANVLVATTIIESGIDIPSANTIIINRADCFGLAQLHQLRGRVGRSDVKAWCYLLVPSPQSLSTDAEQRLFAIQQFSDLGSGFSIASHDLDLRGAGDLMGADQAGNINAVGFETYTELLAEAVAELKRDGGAADDAHETAPDAELRVPVEARIPERWLPDLALRLRLYRDFSRAMTADEVATTLADAIDRYGPAPTEVEALADVMRLKLLARRLRLRLVSLTLSGLTVGLTGRAPLDAGRIMTLVSRRPELRLTPDGLLAIPLPERAPRRGPEALPMVMESLLALERSAISPPPPPAPTAPAAPPSSPRARHDAPPAPTHAPPRPHGQQRLQQASPAASASRAPARRVVDVDPAARRGPRSR